MLIRSREIPDKDNDFMGTSFKFKNLGSEDIFAFSGHFFNNKNKQILKQYQNHFELELKRDRDWFT